MCGRYIVKTDLKSLARQLEVELPESLAAEASAPRYNLAPLQAAPIVTSKDPHRLTFARWGLLPPWAREARLASKFINARCETLLEKPVFRTHLSHERCIVPCDGFYEWTKQGRERVGHFIHPIEPRVLRMAGLFSPWTSPDGLEVLSFTIITTQANADVRTLHDRMPVFLDDDAAKRWLSSSNTDASGLVELLKPWRDGQLTHYQVGPRVNQVAAEGPECLEPARVVQLSLL